MILYLYYVVHTIFISYTTFSSVENGKFFTRFLSIIKLIESVTQSVNDSSVPVNEIIFLMLNFHYDKGMLRLLRVVLPYLSPFLCNLIRKQLYCLRGASSDTGKLVSIHHDSYSSTEWINL